MSWHLTCKTALTPSPARTFPGDMDMKYGVHALREFTCSEHKVTTHEPKASKQINKICNAVSSELGVHQRDLEGCRKPGEEEGRVRLDTVEGRVRTAGAPGTHRVSCRFGCLTKIESVY